MRRHLANLLWAILVIEVLAVTVLMEAERFTR